MSDEVALQREQELEEIKVKEAEAIEKADRCPGCGQSMALFPYVIMMPSPFAWVECPGCGVVFSPLSLRKRKLSIYKQSSDTIITP